MPRRGWSRDEVSDWASVLVLFLVAAAAALTFRGYGLGWDDFTQAQYGELLLSYYRSGLTDGRALSFVNLEMYGGGFDMAADLLAKFLPIDLFETRRLAGALVGVLGLTETWRLARHIGGAVAALAAVILLAACPIFYGHMFINAKDAPFAVVMVILLLAMVRLLSEYPRPRPASLVLFGIGLGLSVGSRTLGVLAGFDMLAALAWLVVIEAKVKGWREALTRAGLFVAWLLPGLLLAYVVMGLVWPWSVQSPLNPWKALTYFSHFFEQPWREFFDGRLILVPDMPRSYVPTLFSLQLPEMFLALSIAGALGAGYAALRRDLPARRRAIFICLIVAAIFPIVLTILVRPAMYNGIRHFVFLMPPLAVLGGLAAAWLFDALSRKHRFGAAAAMAIFAAGIALPIVEIVRLYPFEYTYYNRFIGGVAGAKGRFMLDYWGLSLKQAAQALAAKIKAEKIEKPAGRLWKIAVCGPHPAPHIELGPDFEMTWDAKGADFALMLGVFYCRQFDEPPVAEIKREGVTYARVYDLRGRSYDTLFTYPALVRPDN